ncbi:serine/threonine protein kinase [Paenibacillus sp. FSL k6-2145]|uniref:serine/threonine protein kinase n=1 Tax=Paenibacillus sp. FSL k6-2145 TaxID=2976834 RepID=UPI0030D7E791
MSDFFEHNKDFRESDLPQWENLINSVAGTPVPEETVFTDLEDIKRILKEISKSDASNHTFMPDGGGVDLVGCSDSNEKGCIELDFDAMTHVIKPKKLVLEHFPDVSSEWSYFNLIADELKPSGIYENNDRYYEEVLELSPGKYIDRKYSEIGEYQGKTLPDESRVVLRYFKGSFVIFAKASIYNLADVLDAYNATHEKLGKEGFRNKIHKISKGLKDKGIQ